MEPCPQKRSLADAPEGRGGAAVRMCVATPELGKENYVTGFISLLFIFSCMCKTNTGENPCLNKSLGLLELFREVQTRGPK